MYKTLLWPQELQPTRFLCPCDFPGNNTGVGCHFLLQGIFPTQGSNPYLLQWQVNSFTFEPPFSHKKKEILPFVTTWIDLEGTMLSELSQRNTMWGLLYVKSYLKKNPHSYTRLVVARGQDWWVGEKGEGGQKIQTSRYKINKTWDVMYSMVNILSNTSLCTWKLLRE